jgi:hypothetical protein
VEVALAARQPLSEVLSWDDADLSTMLAVLEARARAVEEARRGR